MAALAVLTSSRVAESLRTSWSSWLARALSSVIWSMKSAGDPLATMVEAAVKPAIR
jgi:hypothetical protein